MRARSHLLTPLAVAAVLATAACGESGSSGGGGGETSGSAAAGDTCAPIAGERLVVLEDDQALQLADNIVPAVNAATASAQPALLPALDAVSAELTTDELVSLNAAVDLERRTVEEVAQEWVDDNGVTDGLEQGSGDLVIGAAEGSESSILATIYSLTLDAAGFSTEVRVVGSRELYLPALRSGAEIQVFPEYLATVTENLNKEFNGPDADPVATNDAQETADVLQPLADQAGLVFGEPAEAVDQNAFAVTQEFAEEHDVSTLSELADVCGDGSLVLGGPEECPTRPFCQIGLEETYGLQFSEFVPLDAGGSLTKNAIRGGEVSVGLVFSSDGALAP